MWSITVRSEWPQNRKRNHPRHREMDTSRISEVKAPLHNGTPRSHDFGTASAPRSRSHAVQIRTVSLVVPIRKFARRPDLHSFARSPDPQHRWASSRRRTRCRAEEAVDHDLGRSASSTLSYRASSPRARARHVVVLVRRGPCRRKKNHWLIFTQDERAVPAGSSSWPFSLSLLNE